MGLILENFACQGETREVGLENFILRFAQEQSVKQTASVPINREGQSLRQRTEKP